MRCADEGKKMAGIGISCSMIIFDLFDNNPKDGEKHSRPGLLDVLGAQENKYLERCATLAHKLNPESGCNRHEERRDIHIWRTKPAV